MKTKILLVDDDKLVLNLMSRWFGDKGYEISVANNSEEFLTKAMSEKPNLIILDIMLGNDNGPLVYDQLLNKGFDSKVPVIFLSGLAQDRPDAPISAGRTYTMHSKSFDLNKLTEEIEVLVNKQSQG